jgi:DNA-binding PadR family transcriptional regulator
MTAWLLLLLEGGASYGYELRRELAANDLEIDASVLYRVLRGLERDGLVESRWMRSDAGPRRRFYRLTAKGRRQLDEIVALIVEIRDINHMYVVAHAQAMRRREDAATVGVVAPPPS